MRICAGLARALRARALVKQMIVARNFVPWNAGAVFVADVFVPVFLIVLYLTYDGPA